MLDINEIKKHLGFGESIETESLNIINEIFNEMTSMLKSKCQYKKFILDVIGDKKVTLENSNIILHGESIANHLKDCTQIYIIVCTLGQQTDRFIQLKTHLSVYYGMIADAVASVMIESLCDECENLIKKQISEKEYLLTRFSPGYGDLPLSDQRSILDEMNSFKILGLSLNDSNLLIPLKSVVAILGVTENDFNKKHQCGNDSCDTCIYNTKCKHAIIRGSEDTNESK